MIVGLGQASTLAAGITRLDPALFLEFYLEFIGDFFGHILGPAFDFAAAALLTLYFHLRADDNSGRVGVCNKQSTMRLKSFMTNPK